jgi:hypothetical protein
MISWHFYPRSAKAIPLATLVVSAFESVFAKIDSSNHDLKSNEVLAVVQSRLTALKFQVETSKPASDKIRVPVLFGLNGKTEKSFNADAYHAEMGFVVEVEAGRGVANNQFLKDLFQACMMHDVYYLAIAVRNNYRGNNDFERVALFFNTLYASNRMTLPLKGILLIGY